MWLLVFYISFSRFLCHHFFPPISIGLFTHCCSPHLPSHPPFSSTPNENTEDWKAKIDPFPDTVPEWANNKWPNGTAGATAGANVSSESQTDKGTNTPLKLGSGEEEGGGGDAKWRQYRRDISDIFLSRVRELNKSVTINRIFLATCHRNGFAG